MKKLIIVILLLPLLSFAQRPGGNPTVVSTLTDLRKMQGYNGSAMYVAGIDSVNDWKGGFYRYDTAATCTDDNYTCVKPDSIATNKNGRWTRLNQSTLSYGAGNMFRVGALKVFAGTANTNSSGEITVNLTQDNTSTGTALFNNILFASCMATRNSNNAQDVVMGTIKNITSGNKQITYKLSTGTTVSLLGVVTLTSAPSGLPVQYFIVGF